MQYFGAVSKMTEWSLSVSKKNHSVSQKSKFMPQTLMLKKLNLNSSMKNQPSNARDIKDVDFIPASRRSPRGENGIPFQYTCLENPMDRRAWWVTVHGVT